jgi:hypothetical protein
MSHETGSKVATCFAFASDAYYLVQMQKQQQLLEEKEVANRQTSQQYGERLEELKEKRAALEESVESDQPPRPVAW